MTMAEEDVAVNDTSLKTPWKHMVDVPVERAELRDEDAIAAEVKKRQLFGVPEDIHLDEKARVRPPREKFMWCEDEFAKWPPGFIESLPNILAPPPAEVAPKGRTLPQSPEWRLVRDDQFASGWVYEAYYSIPLQWDADRDLQMRVTSPASVKPFYNKTTDSYVMLPIAGLVNAKPGIPMVYRVQLSETDDPKDAFTFTLACSQTLDSLQHYSDFPTILKLCNVLAKHMWGTEDVTAISDLDMKLNDRTVTSRAFKIKDGSYSLSLTVMKGEGLGTVLPASQADSNDAREKITSVLRIVNELCSLVLPKCISKFEWEMIRWHTRFNNVVQFGDKVAGPTSVQLNCSSFGKELAELLGKQGFWHPDPKDHSTRYTVFILFLNVGEFGDAGAFLLARGGIYVRELNQWVVILVFKGTDMHSGHTPSESRARFEERMDKDPPTFFGNLVPSHREGALNLMQHASVAMGGPIPHAKWVAREIVMQFWNNLQLANLDMAIDINTVMESLSTTFNDKKIDMGPLPYHPIKDQEVIQEYTGYWAFYKYVCNQMMITNVRSLYKSFDKEDRVDPSTKSLGKAFRMAGNTAREMEGDLEGIDLDSIEVEQYLDRKEVIVDSKPEIYFTLKLKDRDHPVDIPLTLLKARNELYEKIKAMLPKRSSHNTPLISSNPKGGRATISKPITQKRVRSPSPADGAEPAPVDTPSTSKHQSARKRSRREKEVGVEIQPEDVAMSGVEEEPQSVEDIAPVEDNDTFVVEKILNDRINSVTGKPEYEVQWKGYPEDDTTWLPIPNLVGAMELVKEYREQKELEEVMSQGEDQPVAERMKYDEFLFDGETYKVRVGPLWTALHPARLLSENEDLKSLTTDRTLSAKKLKEISVYKAFGTFLEGSSRHAMLHDVTFMAPTSDMLQVGFSQLHCAVESSEGSASLFSELVHLTMAARASQWQLGRALAFLYQWWSELQPAWLEHARLQFADMGYKQFFESSSDVRPLADLFRHSLWLIWTLAQLGKGWRTIPDPPAEFGPQPTNIYELPATLYGLRNSGSPISLSTKGSRHRKAIVVSRFRKVKDGQYNLYYITAGAVVASIIQFEVLAPNLREIDLRLNQNKIKKETDLDRIWQRVITRGAILYSIANALGTDAIFASKIAFDAITYPSFIHNDAVSNSKNYLYHLQKDGVVAALTAWLRQRLDPETAKSAMALGTTIHQFIRDSYDGTNKVGSSSSKGSDGRKCIFGPVTPEELVPLNGHNADYSMMGLIICETLNDVHGLKMAEEIVYRVLKGKHSSLASTIHYNPDHTNPIRHSNISASLFKSHIPPNKLTTRSGLPCAIAWHVTGQGHTTKPWLDTISNFYSTSAALLLSKFEKADDHNTRLLSMSGSKKKLLKNSDLRVYGSASNYLGLTPTKKGEGGEKVKMEPSERLEQCFKEEIQNCWVKWLGDMHGHDPVVWKGKRKSWAEAWKLVVSLKIPGLGGGLAALQLTNAISLSKVAKMPTSQEIADWVWRNPSKGAFKGLELLGFYLPNTNAVRYAFKSIENHLQAHLSEADQILLGLGPMFIEHLLCKVSRYKSRLAKEGQTEAGKTLFFTLAREALEIARNTPWVHKHPRTDPAVFPFPLLSEPIHISKAILFFSLNGSNVQEPVPSASSAQGPTVDPAIDELLDVDELLEDLESEDELPGGLGGEIHGE